MLYNLLSDEKSKTKFSITKLSFKSRQLFYFDLTIDIIESFCLNQKLNDRFKTIKFDAQ